MTVWGKKTSSQSVCRKIPAAPVSTPEPKSETGEEAGTAGSHAGMVFLDRKILVVPDRAPVPDRSAGTFPD